MRYPCLVMDHDDTVVNSSATIHYPCFLEYLAIYRPGVSIGKDAFFQKNFDPGFLPMCREDFGLTDAELAVEQEFWHRYVTDHIPTAVAGMRALLRRHADEGGVICVVSHSMSDHIRRDWRENGLPEPKLIFGWDAPSAQRKPSPYPLLAIMDALGFSARDLLVVDDLKPGCDMARDAGVDFAAAGWAYSTPAIEAYMRKNSRFYAPTVADLARFLFS